MVADLRHQISPGAVRRRLRAAFPQANAELTHSAKELEELRREVLEQSDSRVIIDLGRVTKIDSAGLGQLMSCYSHLVRNQGSLKVVNATPEVRKVLDMTGISYPDPLLQRRVRGRKKL